MFEVEGSGCWLSHGKLLYLRLLLNKMVFCVIISTSSNNPACPVPFDHTQPLKRKISRHLLLFLFPFVFICSDTVCRHRSVIPFSTTSSFRISHSIILPVRASQRPLNCRPATIATSVTSMPCTVASTRICGLAWEETIRVFSAQSD